MSRYITCRVMVNGPANGTTEVLDTTIDGGEGEPLIVARFYDRKEAEKFVACVNTHAALRASHAELVKALTKITATQDCGCRPCRGQCDSHAALKVWIEEAQDLARTALSNAAKVEVGHE